MFQAVEEVGTLPTTAPTLVPEKETMETCHQPGAMVSVSSCVGQPLDLSLSAQDTDPKFHYRSLIGLGTLIALLLLPSPSLSQREVSTTISSYWSMGLGELRDYTFISVPYPRNDPWGLISNVILANVPQLLASTFYLLYNGILTTFLVQFEFSSMYKTRKSLRVSEPLGTQRSSYPISLPFRYGIPLFISSGVMSWLLSQSLFLARITALRPDGTPDRANSFSSTGYSPIAIFLGK